MNVRVTKFDRFFDASKVCVGFYVMHPNSDTGLFVDAAVPMNGTDADMVEAAWIDVFPRVVSWTKNIQPSTVGQTFSVPILVVQPTLPTTTISEEVPPTTTTISEEPPQ